MAPLGRRTSVRGTTNAFLVQVLGSSSGKDYRHTRGWVDGGGG